MPELSVNNPPRPEISFPINTGMRSTQTTGENYSEQEQTLLSEIQDLQRQLFELKADNDAGDEDKVGDPSDLETIMGKDRRLIMVSNRLPVSKVDRADGSYELVMSSGGLVSALSGVQKDLDFIWIGWIGCEIDEAEQPELRRRLLEEHNCLPVFLSDDIIERYYNGFSNGVLWPLFHYVPLSMYKAGTERKFDTDLWEAYKEANIAFAEAVMSIYQPKTDLIWVHDYHLMRLPAELRSRRPKCRIAWYLHTPFPTSEIYRILPVRRELLEGLLKADLVAFQTYDYARHFLSACSRVLEIESSPKGVEYENHYCAIGVHPIGVDADYIRDQCKSEGVKSRVKELEETFAGRKILLGVDRLDYIKGMPHKLLGLELFLARHPEWRGKVTLIQIGVPTREGVPEYQKLGQQVNELVGRINGTHGTLEYSPIHYINQSVPQDELFAIYRMADVCLVTSVRDGMNLVSHEYVVAQEEWAGEKSRPSGRDGPGVLVLSEFAGSAQSLSGAVRVNPWNTEELAAAIHTALSLRPIERELRHNKLYRYVSTHTAAYWATMFMGEFSDTIRSKRVSVTKALPALNMKKVVNAYERARNRLIVCDYDGTLTKIQTLPQLAQPAPALIDILKTLSADPRNTIIIMSGRERRFLESWLGQLRVGLAAEYGFYHRLPGPDSEWQSIGEEIELSWKELVAPIMKYFTERTPGTYIESKESSLAWHFKDADPHFGAWQAKDMQVSMEDVLSNLPLEIIQGNHIVEVRHRAVSKARVLEAVLEHLGTEASVQAHGGAEVDFIFCVGDDRSDEDMFQFLQTWKDDFNSPPPSATPLPEGPSPPPGVPPGDAAPAANKTEAPPVSAVSSSAGLPEAGGLSRGASAGGVRRCPTMFNVHIGNDASLASSFVENTFELRRVLRAFSSVSKKDSVLRDLGVADSHPKVEKQPLGPLGGGGGEGAARPPPPPGFLEQPPAEGPAEGGP